MRNRQLPRRMPFAAREEVARQLRKMQDMDVIQPSESPWSSPVILVQKKDGSHRVLCGLSQVKQCDKG